MTENTESNFKVEVLRATLYGEAFDQSTLKTGRNLTIVATIALIATVFDVGVKSTPLLPLDFSKHPHSLLVFLAVANIVLLVSYLLRATSDLVRAAEEWAEAKKQIELERIGQALQAARAVDRAISDAEPNPSYGPIVDEWWEKYEEQWSEAKKRIQDLENRIADRRLPVFMRWLRLSFFGIVPLLISLLALIHTWRGVVAFVAAVLGLNTI